MHCDNNSTILELTRLIQAVTEEEQNSANTLHMTANENILSEAAQRLMASGLSHRYYSDTYDSEDKPFNQKCYSFGNAVYRGLPAVFEFEDIARQYANRMFHAAFTDFTPLSGMHAVICIVLSITKPGDKIFCFSPKSIGHHATIQLFKPLIAPLIHRQALQLGIRFFRFS